ncbi:MAG: hypothetical protein DRN49_03265 [Thaumarchaeota archaeon]|nr:MAG: hypothetical protein DRN49_03265 [Nitrososphaerota archaeon]
MPDLIEIIKDALIEGHKVLEKVLKAGGREIRGRGAYGDMSYEFDLAVEKAIINFLRQNLDGCMIISEESGIIRDVNPRYYVLMDPVDGSKNAWKGIPFYCTSISIAEGPRISDVVAAGVIDHPRNKFYLGEIGVGVEVSGKKPRLSMVRSLKDAMLLIDHDSMKRIETREWTLKIIQRCKGTRFFAAASLETALILDGAVEGFLCPSRSLKLMDFMAPAFLVKLAGGHYRVVGGDMDTLLMDSGKFGVLVTSTQELLDEILSLKCDHQIEKR